MNIKVKDQIGVRCLIKEDGQKIYNLVHDYLRENKEVILDFTGVIQYSSPFFNYAIGQLLKDITLDTVKKCLKIIDINEIGENIIERVLSNASRYYASVDYKKIVDEMLYRHQDEV